MVKSRKAINRDYDKKRLEKPCINAIRDVPADTIKQLEAIAAIDGSKKESIINAIADRYKKIKRRP